MRSLVSIALLLVGCRAAEADPAPMAAAAMAVRAAQVELKLSVLERGDAAADLREPPADYVTVKADLATGPQFGDAVLLYAETEKRVMPIYIGGTEALSIRLRLNGQRFTRPLTHDLFDDALHKLGGRVLRVQVDTLRDSVYVGSVVLERDGRVLSLDARPSDAIALALGSGVPIYVSKSLLKEAGIDLEQLHQAEPQTPVEPVAL